MNLEDKLRQVTPETVEQLRDTGRRTGIGIATIMIPVMLAFGGWMAWRDLQPYFTWRAADAIVMQSDIQRVPWKMIEVRWRPRVQYRWAIDGRWHTGDRYAITSMVYRRQREAWRIAHRYTGEQHVTAWVDPKDHDEAVLDRTPNFFPYLFLSVVVLLTLLFSFVIDTKPRYWRRSGSGWDIEIRTPDVPSQLPRSGTDPSTL